MSNTISDEDDEDEDEDALSCCVLTSLLVSFRFSSSSCIADICDADVFLCNASAASTVAVESAADEAVCCCCC